MGFFKHLREEGYDDPIAIFEDYLESLKEKCQFINAVGVGFAHDNVPFTKIEDLLSYVLKYFPQGDIFIDSKLNTLIFLRSSKRGVATLFECFDESFKVALKNGDNEAYTRFISDFPTKDINPYALFFDDDPYVSNWDINEVVSCFEKEGLVADNNPITGTLLKPNKVIHFEDPDNYRNDLKACIKMKWD
ncbi:hypothetical protein SYNTR_1163 [Candidatus Syntrophocurvum alkaliphilum]|uniref:Uncharacterized protein n=2 Tax=Candidatus Syntrophocurvum alkaliphilum TaxID=2293317 RepID=A0A6I6DEY8_9FIRM|nr:hypothetical protein SYNTR_1163 [Candidatus Syntrophocurvum alkaliphilum]